jgi:hypothetical protein
VFAQGRLLVKPYIQVDWQSDSNFHKSETNEKTVYTYTVNPGIEMGYTTDKTLMSLKYGLRTYKYDDQDENIPGQKNADKYDYTAHDANFRFQTQATKRVLLGLDNTFTKTRDPASADEVSNSPEDRYKYNLNRFTPRVNYRFGEKYSLDVKYTNLYTDYRDDGPGQGEDSTENRGTFILNYHFSPKTSFNLDYQYWQRDYDKTTDDYDSNQITMNVSHQFNRLVLNAGAGYHKREFDQKADDLESFVWNFSGTWKLPKSSVTLGVSSNLNDAGTGDTYFNATRLNASFSHLFMEKIRGTLSGYYQNSDYETSSRDDDRWLVSLGADYLINRYFTVGISGGHEERDSNKTGMDFDNQYVMLKARFNYDLGSR